jgi:hypothetical protein
MPLRRAKGRRRSARGPVLRGERLEERTVMNGGASGLVTLRAFLAGPPRTDAVPVATAPSAFAAGKATPDLQVEMDRWGNASIAGRLDRAEQEGLYHFTATVAGVLFVSPAATSPGSWDVHVSLYSNSGQLLASNDDESAARPVGLAGVDVQAGATYRLRIDGHGSATGDYRVALRTALSRTDDVPNDFAHASSLSLPSGSGSREGVIEIAGDADMYTFTAPLTGRMWVRQQLQTQSRVDPYLYAYDVSQRLLAASNDAEGGLTSLVVIDVTAGNRYYLKAAANGNSTGAYRLALVTTTYNDDFGNSFGTAKALNAVDTGAAAMLGNVEVGYDVDVFSFTTAKSGPITVKLSAMSGSALDTHLFAYASDGTLLAENNNGPQGTDSQLVINGTAGARYYVKAAGANNTTGAYFLQIVTPAWVPPDDFGNTIAAAKVLNLSAQGSGAVQGNIEVPSDVDVFRFTTQFTGQVTIRQSASGSTLDTVLYVYNADGNLVAQNNNGPLGTDSLVTMNVCFGVTYYVKAAGAGGTSGAYLLQIQNTAAPSSTGKFNITLALSGMTADQQRIARDAAARWQRMIVGDLPDVVVNGQRIDDILIQITGKDIDRDGTKDGNTLGYAGWEFLRPGNGLPCQGAIVIDTYDILWMQRQGRLLDVLTHEIGHVLGFDKTFWQLKGLLQGDKTLDPRFTGARAAAEYRALFGNRETGVPLEDHRARPGTEISHWRETVFTTELMTGWNDITPNAFSRVTIAAMADLGYTVNMAAAEPFARPGTSVLAYGAAVPTTVPSASRSLAAPATRAAHDFLFSAWQDAGWSTEHPSRIRRPGPNALAWTASDA